MNHKTYIKVSGTIILFVALAHLWRALNNIPVKVGSTNVPVSISWVAAVVAGYLAYSAFKKH